MSVNERRLEIIKILEGRREELVANFAQAFGVSIRTIKYDIEALKAEYPIETVRGNGGCVRLPKGYREYMGSISEDKQNALLKAIPVVDRDTARHFCELLRAQGSFRNKSRITEVIENYG